MLKAEQVLRYWFGAISNELASSKQMALWYQATPEIDNEIKAQFEHLHQQAMNGDFAVWLENSRGSLAAVILLDQMPRNMFRASANAFGSDALALQICRQGIAKGFDKEMSLIERIFYYHPFEHSEKLADQTQCVQLFSQLLNEYKEEGHIAVINNAKLWAVEHFDIIKRFGRFPHRNIILNRTSTMEEVEFLKIGPDFGQKAK